MDLHPRGVGHQHNGPSVTRLLDNKVNLALTQLAFQHGEHLDIFYKWLVSRFGRQAYQQVNVAAFFAIVCTRAKYPNRSARAKCGRCGMPDGL